MIDSDIGLPTAYVRYNEVVVWKKPGGVHHIKILKRGDKVSILAGWKYDERTRKDKNYIKVLVNNVQGYVLAAALSNIEPPLKSKKEEMTDDERNDYVS